MAMYYSEQSKKEIFFCRLCFLGLTILEVIALLTICTKPVIIVPFKGLLFWILALNTAVWIAAGITGMFGKIEKEPEQKIVH